jgi:hypothetical protein
MKNHVTSLEVSKELAKILPEGYGGEFYWARAMHTKEYIERERLMGKSISKWSDWVITIEYELDVAIRDSWAKKKTEHYPALLLTEVLELLPIMINHYEYVFRFYKSDRFKGTKHHEVFYCIGYRLAKDNTEILCDMMDANPAIAAAKLCLWLVENGYELEVK